MSRRWSGPGVALALLLAGCAEQGADAPVRDGVEQLPATARPEQKAETATASGPDAGRPDGQEPAPRSADDEAAALARLARCLSPVRGEPQRDQFRPSVDLMLQIGKEHQWLGKAFAKLTLFIHQPGNFDMTLAYFLKRAGGSTTWGALVYPKERAAEPTGNGFTIRSGDVTLDTYFTRLSEIDWVHLAEPGQGDGAGAVKATRSPPRIGRGRYTLQAAVEARFWLTERSETRAVTCVLSQERRIALQR